MTKIRAAITGVMGFVPEDVLSNQDLEKLVDTNDEWILSRTGISERRIQRGEGLGVTDIALPAVKGLLEKTGTKPEEIERITIARSEKESGIHEALLCMRIGDKAKLILPSYLGHGLLGDRIKIPPQSILYIDIQLLALQ